MSGEKGEGEHWIDQAWKDLITGNPDDAISFFMPELAEVRNNAIEPTCLPPKHPAIGGDSDKGSTESDVCLELSLKTGSPSRAVFIVEQQHEKDNALAERIFKSWYRASDEHKVPVTCLAIYTGKTDAVDTYTREWQGTSVVFKYNAYSVAKTSAEELKLDGRDFAVPILAAKRMLEAGGDASKREEYSLELLQEIKERDFDPVKKFEFQRFTSRILQINKSDISQAVKEEWKVQGISIEEARNERFVRYVKEESKIEIAQNFLKMGRLTLDEIAQGTELSLEEVADIQKELQNASLPENAGVGKTSGNSSNN